MEDPRTGEMASGETLHPSPRPATATTLTAAADYFQPKTSHLVHEAADAVTVARDGMIIQPTLDNTSQPTGRLAKWPVHSLSQFSFDRLQGRADAFRHGVAMDGEPAALASLGTLVREAKKIKRFRPALATSNATLQDSPLTSPSRGVGRAFSGRLTNCQYRRTMLAYLNTQKIVTSGRGGIYTARGQDWRFWDDATLTRSASEAVGCVPRLRFGLVSVLAASGIGTCLMLAGGVWFNPGDPMGLPATFSAGASGAKCRPILHCLPRPKSPR